MTYRTIGTGYPKCGVIKSTTKKVANEFKSWLLYDGHEIIDNYYLNKATNELEFWLQRVIC